MKRWTWLLAAILAVTALAACSDSGATDGTDGDSSSGSFGQACTINADCDSGMCVGATASVPGFCSMACSADAECQQLLFGACCENNGGYCKTADLCGGDTPDGDTVTDGDDPVLCTADDFRCVGNDLQRCNSSGDWELYRDCSSSGKICVGTECVDTADGDTTPDGDTAGCEPGERRCSGDDVVERCNTHGDDWETWEECGVTQTCQNGECITPLGDPCTLEEGCADDREYCLPDAVGSITGNCMPFCDTAGVNCPRGWSCEHGQCEPISGYCTSDNDCEQDEFCNKLPLNNDGRCQRYCDLAGENCPELYECIDNPEDVNYGRCVLEDPTCNICTYDAECNVGQYCEVIAGQQSGCCKPSCSSDADCPGTLSCSPDGRCVVGSGNGDCGGCPPGYICDKTFGVCVLNCPACGANECCDAESAPSCYICACENPAVCGILLPPCCFGYSCSAVVYGVLGYCI
jgi:hypothetical protein